MSVSAIMAHMAMKPPHPHHATHLSLAVIATAVVLAVAFHFLPAERPYGFALALFFVLLVAGMHVVSTVAGNQGNRWAYLFLIPAGLATLAEILYAAPAVRALGFLIGFGSLAFFAYWSAAPRAPFWEVRSFWPWTMVTETLIPFGRIGELFGGTGLGRRGMRIVLGAILAVPFLLVFGALFASADPLFSSAVGTLFSAQKLPEYAAKGFRDLVVLLYFLGAGWMIATRILEHRRPKEGAPASPPDRTALVTFLGLINALFAVFLAYQFAYFFGGESFIQAQGLTYAEYARTGFFQLLWASGLVTIIVGTVYRVTDMRQWATRELALALIAQAGVVLVSAGMRLSLYVDAYGLTVSRWWAAAVIALIGGVLVAVFGAALAKRDFSWMAKVVSLGAVTAFAALLLVNVEGAVVRYDAKQFLEGKTARLDVWYLANLDADAMPALTDLMLAPWPTENPVPRLASNASARMDLTAVLKNRRAAYERASIDWRDFVVADYRAMAALARVSK